MTCKEIEKTYIHTYTPTCLPACLPTYVRAYMHTYMHTCIHAYMHTCIHAYIRTYIHIHIHTYRHIHIHTYIHIYVLYIQTHKLADASPPLHLCMYGFTFDILSTHACNSISRKSFMTPPEPCLTRDKPTENRPSRNSSNGGKGGLGPQVRWDLVWGCLGSSGLVP